MITDDRLETGEQQTLADRGKLWSTEIQTIAGPVIRVRRVGTTDVKKIPERDQWREGEGRNKRWRGEGWHKDGTYRSREVHVDYRVSVDGRLVDSFLSKSRALAFAKDLAAKTDALFA
jgi:hypothetical protein